jgi:hypothetical protein
MGGGRTRRVEEGESVNGKVSGVKTEKPSVFRVEDRGLPDETLVNLSGFGGAAS